MAQLWCNRLKLLKIPYVFFLSIFCNGYYWSVDLSRDRIGGRRWKITEPIVIHVCIRFRYHDDVANCHIEFTRTDTWMSIMESTFQFAFPLQHGTWMHRGPYFVCSQSIATRLLSASLLRRFCVCSLDLLNLHSVSGIMKLTDRAVICN